MPQKIIYAHNFLTEPIHTIGLVRSYYEFPSWCFLSTIDKFAPFT